MSHCFLTTRTYQSKNHVSYSLPQGHTDQMFLSPCVLTTTHQSKKNPFSLSLPQGENNHIFLSHCSLATRTHQSKYHVSISLLRGHTNQKSLSQCFLTTRTHQSKKFMSPFPYLKEQPHIPVSLFPDHIDTPIKNACLPFLPQGHTYQSKYPVSVFPNHRETSITYLYFLFSSPQGHYTMTNQQFLCHDIPQHNYKDKSTH